LNLKYVENIRGFDPNGIFLEHMLTMGFSNSTLQGPNKKISQSPNITPKTSTPRRSAPMTHPSKKLTNTISIARGDKNPPLGKIEISHKLPLRKKRNNIVQ